MEDKAIELASRAQLRLTALCVAALNLNIPAASPARRAAIYHDQALMRGYCDNKGKLRLSALARDISARYDGFDGHELKERLLSTPHHPMRWLGDLFSRPERSLHPICHLLLIEHLWGKLYLFKEDLEAAGESNRAGGGDALSSDECPESHCLDRAVFLNDVSLSCRAVADLIGVSVNTVVLHRKRNLMLVNVRPKKIRPEVTQEIMRELFNGKTAEEISQLLNISPASIHRIRAVEAPVLRKIADIHKEKRRSVSRSAWLSLLRRDQDIGKARASHQGLYAWLYRNDLEWLLSANSNYARKRVVQPRLDWGARDHELCLIAAKYVGQKLTDSTRKRMSRSALRRHLGEARISTNIAKLPMYKLLEDRLHESIKVHTKIRIMRAMSALQSDGISLDLWRIQRVAGLKCVDAESLNFIEDCILRNRSK
ncbi:TnsD family Tn7-like transposition protein [Herbaspirillum chlorophenolicum]|uniref:TnsD family Tn7-like transposition protein n=2 Tax=Herbaspirillum chlorophenolicum TaxID=211589 RepID=UPI001FD001FC|nr:TnsD family Tn7-like transposition protein [Herbaspirillum chlorophenolicum]